MDYYLKVHRSEGHVLVAACDRELLGKTLCGDVDVLVNPIISSKNLGFKAINKIIKTFINNKPPNNILHNKNNH